MFNDNPYQSPADTSKGRYEWPLWRRILYSLLVLLIVYCTSAVSGAWLVYHKSGWATGKPVSEQVVKFFTDWRNGK